jgi:hypothetical protein
MREGFDQAAAALDGGHAAATLARMVGASRGEAS